MAWQRNIEDLRDLGYYINVGPGDYLATQALFDWIEEHYPTAPQLYAPLAGQQYHASIFGMLPKTDVQYTVEYRSGHLAFLRIETGHDAATFRTWKRARSWLLQHGRWVQQAEDDERAENVFERHVYGYDW